MPLIDESLPLSKLTSLLIYRLEVDIQTDQEPSLKATKRPHIDSASIAFCR